MVAVPPQRQLIECPYPRSSSIHSAMPEDDAPRLEPSNYSNVTVGIRALD
jgi:hypothetical protein